MDVAELEKARVDRKVRLVCIWVTAPMLVLLAAGLVLAGCLPAVPPGKTALQVAHHYRTRRIEIITGLAIAMNSVFLLFFYGSAIAGTMRRIKNCPRTLIYAQVSALAASSLIFLIPAVCWLTAAYRPDRAPSEILMFNDLGWMTFIFSYFTFNTWIVAVGVGILLDNAKKPVYPRWIGFYSIFTAVTFLPDNLIPYFKNGALCWNGVFTYYLPFLTYGIWLVAMFVLTRKAILEEAKDEAALLALLASDDGVPVEPSGVQVASSSGVQVTSSGIRERVSLET